MAKSDITRNKIKSKISAIKKLAEDPKPFADNIYDRYHDRIGDNTGILKKNINDFRSKVKGRTKNQKDIFGEILDLSDIILGEDKGEKTNPKEKPIIKKKLIRYSKDAARITLQSSKQIIIDETLETLFGGVNVCSPENSIGTTTIEISPKEFDFLNMLKVSPSTVTGKLMYERDEVTPTNDVKFNKVLYTSFDDPSTYSFVTKNNETLFTVDWNAVDQKYVIGGITPTLKIGEFFDKYYNTIEHPSIDDIVKTSIELMLGGDGEESPMFKEAMARVNRLLDKIFSICGEPKNQNPLRQNTTTTISEDEYDLINYFDFDSTEGIDLDDEDARIRGVLKFRDCNNFETQINPNFSEDFVYHLGKKPIDENLFNTLDKMALDAYEESGGTVYIDLFLSSLMTSFIKFIPRALVTSMLSPKMIFPIALMYRVISQTGEMVVTTLIRNLNKLFYNIMRSVLWKFITEFWGYMKKDLLKFVRDVATKILVNKVKKIKGIVGVLIAMLTRIMESDIQSCDEVFNTMLQTLTTALNRKVKVPIPGLLLVMSDGLPGYSNERAYMNIMERIEASGIDTGPIYGTENTLPLLVKAIIDGHGEEIDTNSFVQIALKPSIIPSGPGGAVISPMIVGTGKMF